MWLSWRPRARNMWTPGLQYGTFLRATENRSAAQTGHTGATRVNSGSWQQLRHTSNLYTAVYFRFPSTASLNSCGKRTYACYNRPGTLPETKTFIRRLVQTLWRTVGEHTHTHTHTQLHEMLALHHVSSGYFHHTATCLKDLTISFQEASFISWQTSPKLKTTKRKGPTGELLGSSPQPPKTVI